MSTGRCKTRNLLFEFIRQWQRQFRLSVRSYVRSSIPSTNWLSAHPEYFNDDLIASPSVCPSVHVSAQTKECMLVCASAVAMTTGQLLEWVLKLVGNLYRSWLRFNLILIRTQQDVTCCTIVLRSIDQVPESIFNRTRKILWCLYPHHHH